MAAHEPGACRHSDGSRQTRKANGLRTRDQPQPACRERTSALQRVTGPPRHFEWDRYNEVLTFMPMGRWEGFELESWGLALFKQLAAVYAAQPTARIVGCRPPI
jgi:hypothetical protein